MTTLTQQLTDKIDSLLGGEIKKLEFGCRFIVGNEIRVFINSDTYRHHYHYGFLHGNGKDVWGVEEVKGEFDHEILGRDPTLADVLRAIDACEKLVKTSRPPYITMFADGKIILQEGEQGYDYEEKASVYWNLTENLSGQSEETLTFLAQVLGVNK